MRSPASTDGFTLVETMIVIAIVGVVLAIALPSYSAAVSTAQVNRVFHETFPYTRIIEDKIGQDGLDGLAADPAGVLGFIDSDLSTVAFGTFEDASNSTVTVTLDGDVSGTVRGAVLTYSRSVFGVWTCSVSNTGPGWDDKYLPHACR